MAVSGRCTAVLDACVLYPRLASDVLLSLAPLAAIKAMRLRWARPELTAQEMINLFEKRGMVKTAAHLRDAIDLI